jgi:purine-binding chemotaxis protein CheW
MGEALTDRLKQQRDLLEQIRVLEKRLIELKREVIRIGSRARQSRGQTESCLFAIFKVNHVFLAFPVSDVEQVELMPAIIPLPQAPSAIVGLINYHGDRLAVLDLAQSIGQTASRVDSDKTLVVCRALGLRFAVLIDEVLEVVSVKPEEIRAADEVFPGTLKAIGIVLVSDRTAFVIDTLSLAISAQVESLERNEDNENQELAKNGV